MHERSSCLPEALLCTDIRDSQPDFGFRVTEMNGQNLSTEARKPISSLIEQSTNDALGICENSIHFRTKRRNFASRNKEDRPPLSPHLSPSTATVVDFFTARAVIFPFFEFFPGLPTLQHWSGPVRSCHPSHYGITYGENA